LDIDDSGGAAESDTSADFAAVELEHRCAGLKHLGGPVAAPDSLAIQGNHQGASSTQEHQEPESWDDNEYEAALRALELTLSRLGDSTAKSSITEEDLVLEPGSGGSKQHCEEEHDTSIPAGTGEAADSFSSFGRHWNNLQQPLAHLSTSGVIQDGSLQYPPKDVQEPKPCHFLPMPVGLQHISVYAYLVQRFRRPMTG